MQYYYFAATFFRSINCSTANKGSIKSKIKIWDDLRCVVVCKAMNYPVLSHLEASFGVLNVRTIKNEK
jgi:hypothetical protein